MRRVAARYGGSHARYQGPKVRCAVAVTVSHRSARARPCTLGQAAQGVGDLGGLVGPAPVRHRGQERRVGLGQQEMRRGGRGRVAQRLRVGERHVARERHHVTGLGALLDHRHVTGEAVKHHPGRRSLLRQQAQHVGVRLPVVDHQRLAGALGDLDVLPEPPALDVGRGMVAVVVQPGLPDSDHPRLPGQRLDLGQHLVRGKGRDRRHLVRGAGRGRRRGRRGVRRTGFPGGRRRRGGGLRVVGVDRDRRVDAAMLLRRPGGPAGRLEVGPDRDHADDSRGPGRGHHFVDGPVDHVQVRVGVEGRPGQGRRRCRGAHHGPFGVAGLLIRRRAGPVPRPPRTCPAW